MDDGTYLLTFSLGKTTETKYDRIGPENAFAGSRFCKFEQTDRKRKRPEYTFLGFHLPPTTFVYLLYRWAVIHFVAKQKKTLKK